MNKKICFGRLRLLWLGLTVLTFDIASKQWIMNHFTLYESFPFLSWLNLTYVQNSGAAFSFLADKGGWQRWFFSFISLAISLTLCIFMYRTPPQKKFINCAYVLIISGTLGNLLNRIVHGVVIDFIDFHLNHWHWPTFNLADIAICIGAIILITKTSLS